MPLALLSFLFHLFLLGLPANDNEKSQSESKEDEDADEGEEEEDNEQNENDEGFDEDELDPELLQKLKKFKVIVGDIRLSSAICLTVLCCFVSVA